MRRIDELHVKYPFYGSRKLSLELKSEGHDANRKRVQRLMRLMGLEALAPKARTSEPHPEHAVYPYLLRGLKIDRANQVWAADVTYIPMKNGFLYLVAIIDWFSRRVLSWRLSATMDPSFCVDALEEALGRFGPPEIFNTDQARSLRRRHSRACCVSAASPLAWTVAGGAWTTSSSSGCGGRSNTKRCTCVFTTTAPRPAPASAATSSSTTANAGTRLSATRRPPPSSRGHADGPRDAPAPVPAPSPSYQSPPRASPRIASPQRLGHSGQCAETGPERDYRLLNIKIRREKNNRGRPLP